MSGKEVIFSVNVKSGPQMNRAVVEISGEAQLTSDSLFALKVKLDAHLDSLIRLCESDELKEEQA